MPLLLRYIGIAVSLGLIAVSVMMNFRFGQSLGKTEWDGLVYGLASACADGFKVILPFAFMAAWIARRWFAAGCCALLWVLFTVYSMTSSLGHSAVNRAETAGAKRHDAASYKDLRRSLELKMQEREKLPSFRAESALVTELETARRHFRFTDSSGCSVIATRHRTFCDSYARLQTEFASAKRAGVLETEIAALLQQIERVAEKGKSEHSDAQSAMLSRLSGLADDYVTLGLTLMLSLVVELGSGLGLYLVMGPHGVAERKVSSDHGGRSFTHEEAWRKARIETAAGCHAVEIDLYRDYCLWLVREDRGSALPLSDFRTWLDKKGIGTPVRKRGRNYRTGIGLKQSILADLSRKAV